MARFYKYDEASSEWYHKHLHDPFTCDNTIEYAFYYFTKKMPFKNAAVLNSNIIVACENKELRKNVAYQARANQAVYHGFSVRIVSEQAWNKLVIKDNEIKSK